MMAASHFSVILLLVRPRMIAPISPTKPSGMIGVHRRLPTRPLSHEDQDLSEGCSVAHFCPASTPSTGAEKASYSMRRSCSTRPSPA
jgi:hypothetical protein